jgi:ADP-ribose pyrophosphatase YjhB (NUDIX family)
MDIKHLPLYNLDNYKRISIVVAGIIFEDRKVLLTKGDTVNVWKTVGGKLMTSEGLEQCIKRESVEELGQELEIINNIPVCCTEKIDDTLLIVFYYHCKLKTKVTITMSGDNEILEWFGINELPDNIFDSTRIAIDHYSKITNK